MIAATPSTEWTGYAAAGLTRPSLVMKIALSRRR